MSSESQRSEIERFAREIRKVEQEVGHSRTIVTGDMNANPFEPGVVGAAGLHGVMTRTQAARGSRVVQGETYPFFYNPMWSHFGDLLAEPAGTYYYERAEYVSYGWQMFDQVLMRPELARRFGPSQIEIIRNIGDISLVKETGIPNEKVGSDHLPLWFALDF